MSQPEQRRTVQTDVPDSNWKMAGPDMGEPEVIGRSIPAESTAQLSSAYKFEENTQVTGKFTAVESSHGGRMMKRQWGPFLQLTSLMSTKGCHR